MSQEVLVPTLHEAVWELVTTQESSFLGPPGSVSPGLPDRMPFGHIVRTYRLRVPSGHLYRIDVEIRANDQITNVQIGTVTFVPDGAVN